MTKTDTPISTVLDRVLVLEMVRVTEAAAIAASKLIGRGNEKAADHAAVEAMRADYEHQLDARYAAARGFAEVLLEKLAFSVDLPGSR